MTNESDRAAGKRPLPPFIPGRGKAEAGHRYTEATMWVSTCGKRCYTHWTHCPYCGEERPAEKG